MLPFVGFDLFALRIVCGLVRLPDVKRREFLELYARAEQRGQQRQLLNRENRHLTFSVSDMTVAARTVGGQA